MVDLVFDLKKKISSFLKDVGSIVLIMTIIMWVLFTFPVNQTNLTAIKVKKKIYIEKSYAGKVGKVIEPVISPLGFDWRIGVGLIASFSAREVFVSTIGIAIGLNQEDEYKKSLNEVLPLETNEVGKRIFTPLIAISLLIFFSLAMQCTSTLAATKKETGSMFLMFFQLMYMTLIAWLSSFTIYQMGVMCGF
jgi:ferrous iron transport protein B